MTPDELDGRLRYLALAEALFRHDTEGMLALDASGPELDVIIDWLAPVAAAFGREAIHHRARQLRTGLLDGYGDSAGER